MKKATGNPKLEFLLRGVTCALCRIDQTSYLIHQEVKVIKVNFVIFECDHSGGIFRNTSCFHFITKDNTI